MKITRTTTFSDTAAATVKLGQSSAAGTETEASRSDHVHGGPSFLVTPAAVTINNDSTLTADSTLVFAAVANTSYWCQWLLGVGSNSDTGFKVSVTVPTSATISMFVGSSTDNGAKPYGNANNTGSSVETDVAGANYQGVYIWAYVENKTNAGNVSLLWAQRSAQAQDTTVIKHSTLQYQVVA